MAQSPYVDRLNLAISQSADPDVRGVRRAELAACFARLGEFAAAEEEIAVLRAEFGDGRSGRVSIMIMCAEAQLIYYRNLGDQARDRMMRAQLLSVAGRDAALSALTSAWLAHISFNLHRHEEMARAAKTSLDTISRDDNDAASRLALTLGDAFYAAEQPEVGNRWYAKAHEHAIKLGDHATIGALTYNRAAMGAFMARIRATESAIGPETVVRLAGEVRTAVNYQAIASLKTLQVLLDYSLASVHILAHRYADATVLLRTVAGTTLGTSPIERALVVQCDLALCLATIGDVESARSLALSVSLEQLARYTADDRVVALAALSQASEQCGLQVLQSEAAALLALAKVDHSETVTALRRSLATLGEEAAIARL